jgi:hypothetical protein
LSKDYYLKNKKRVLQKNKEWRDKNKYHLSLIHKKYYKKNKKQLKKYHQLFHLTLKIIIIQVYTKGKMNCMNCGYNENIDALTIDHIDNNGFKFRNKDGRYGDCFYHWIIFHNFPNNLQILCSNCNLIKETNKRQ